MKPKTNLFFSSPFLLNKGEERGKKAEGVKDNKDEKRKNSLALTEILDRNASTSKTSVASPLFFLK